MEAKTFFEHKIKELAKCENVVDIGAGSGFQKELSSFKHLFGTNYRSLDYNAQDKPDIVGDAHDLPFKDGELDGVISISVLEHLHNPILAVSEIKRVLRKGGKFLAYVPFLFPYHAKEGTYNDYYRFAPDAVRDLFKDFSHLEFVPTRRFFESWLYMLPKLGIYLAPFGKLLDRIIKPGSNQVSGFVIFAVR